MKDETKQRIKDGIARYFDPNRPMQKGDIVKYREVVDPSDATYLYVLLDDPAEQSEATKAGEAPARVDIKLLGSNLPFPPIHTRNLDELRLATGEEIKAADLIKLEER